MRYLIQHWLVLSVKFGQSFGFVLACVITQLAVAQGIEEVTIQAEIQEDAALDDLVSVSSLSAEKLADAGIENVEDVAAYVPNLVLTQTETGTSIVIRGIGAGANQGFDQSVGLYIDGVPLPRANMARAPFLDLSSVQVLRGPQYVLDGNYSIAGSVHMLSDLSVDEFKSGIDINYVPSQNAQSLLLTAGGPLSDTFAARVAIQSKRSDGYVENVTRNEGNESDDLVARLVLGFFPTDNLSFKLKVEKGRFKTVGRAVEIFLDEKVPVLEGRSILFDINQDGVIDALDGGLVTRQPNSAKYTTAFLQDDDFRLIAHKTSYDAIDGFGDGTTYAFSGKSYLERLAELYTNPSKDVFAADGGASQATPTPFPLPRGLLDDSLNYKRGADAAEFSDNSSENFTLNIEYWFGEHNFKSASSYITYEFTDQFDADFTAAPLVVSNQTEEYEQLFQRIDYVSPVGNFIEVKAGMSHLHSNLTYFAINKLQLSEKPTQVGLAGVNYANFTFDPDEVIRHYLGSVGLQFATLALESYSPERLFTQGADVTAAYFQTTINWADTFRTRLGFRYTHAEKDAVRDLAIVDKDGNAPATSTGVRNVDARAIQDMFKTYLSIFGVQNHTDRYSIDRNVTGFESFGVPAVRGSRRKEQLLPSLTLEWDVSEDLSVFASARMANKLGGFDAKSNTSPKITPGTGAPPGTFEFEDEDATTYELGTKWYLPYGLGEMTSVIFYTDYKNLQVSRFDGKTGFNVDNAGAANSKGIEIEGMLQFTDQFNMNYSLAWIDFTFDDFVFGTCHLGERPDHTIFLSLTKIGLDISDGSPAVFGEIYPLRYEEVDRQPDEATIGPGPKPALKRAWVGRLLQPNFVDDFDNTSAASPAFCDFKGKTNQFVAEWQGTFSFNYEAELKDIGLFKPTLDVIYNSGYFASVSQDPLAKQEEYVQLNGRLALVSFEDTWTVALTGQNLTNQKIISYANDTPLGSRFQGARGFIGFVRPPRTIGLNLRYNFY